ncbi:unnamed protein product [Lampetra planeri]
MSTRRRVRVWASDNKDDEELIPPTTAEEGAEALPAEQSAVRPHGSSPSLEALLKDAHSRLADLLQAASSILTEIPSLYSAVKGGAAELSGRSDSAAISQMAGTSSMQPRSQPPFYQRVSGVPDELRHAFADVGPQENRNPLWHNLCGHTPGLARHIRHPAFG